MTSTLKLLWFRARKTKELPILLLVAFIYSFFAVLINGISANILYNNMTQSGFPPVITIFRSDILLDLLSPTGLPMLSCALAITIFISTDWKNNTFRNQVLSGKSRNQIYLAYMLFAFVTYLIFLAITILPVYTLSYGFHIGNMSEMESPFILILFIFFMLNLTMVSIAFGFSFIFHNRLAPIGMIVAFLSLIGFSSLITSCFPVITNKSYSFLFNTYPINEFSLGYQLSLSNLKDLDHYRIGELLKDESETMLSITQRNGRTAVMVTKSFFTNLIWQGLMSFFGNLAFRKRDMK